MATPNQLTESESAAHSPGTPVDPFAVDFFGGAPQPGDENEEFPVKEAKNLKRRRAQKNSDWHKNLARVSNAEAEFSAIISNLPVDLSETAAQIISKTVARYTHRQPENVSLAVISIREVNLHQAFGKLSESPRVFLTVGIQTDDSSALAALNVEFADSLIDSMLGEPSPAVRDRNNLSPIETTIIEFLAANVLGEINRFFAESLLFLQNVKNEPHAGFEPFERGAEMIVGLNAGDFRGVVTVLFPHRFLKSLDKTRIPFFTEKTHSKKLSDFFKIARELGLRLPVGTTFLDAESLLYLEPDDIVLIEQPQIVIDGGRFTGNLEVLVGRGSNFRLRGTAEEAVSRSSGVNFRIEEIISEEVRRRFTPAKFEMDENENDLTNESAFENENPAGETAADSGSEERISPSLENIQVALRVEIAGSKISLRELQNLRPGQIIALGASPTDPVRLVTDQADEPVATGELVEIEGQLGVRLTKVFI